MNRTAGIALGLCALLAGGCFFPNLGGLGAIDEPFPTVLATYTSGTAHLRLVQGGVTQDLTLERVGAGSTLSSLMGATVTWRNDDGWVLQVTAYDIGGLLAPKASGKPDTDSYSGDISIQRVNGHEYWRADGYGMSGNRCIVDVVEVDGTEISGSATCRGLRWADGLVAPGIGDPLLIEDQEPFDVEVTFEATP
jgi:hypothetical protein